MPYNIDTAYKPEFALGALYSGENAAYNEQMQNQDVLKAFLANQREQQMQPLDIQKAQWEASSAQDKLMDPEYRKWALKGYTGQMKSQDAAGETAQVLAPFKRKAEQGQYETEAANQENLRTIRDIDSKILQGGSIDEQGNLVPFSPQNAQQMQQIRNKLIEQMGTTDKFWQKQSLQDDKLASAEYIAELRRLQAEELARLKVSLTEKKDPKTAEETIQRLLQKMQSGQSLTPSEVEVYALAKSILESKNAARVQPGSMLDTSKLPPDVPIKDKGGQPGIAMPGTQSTPPAGQRNVIKYDKEGNRIP